MQTQFPSSLLSTDVGREADAILRRCVHCGFCNATCPTYQLTGDELDGPRGRIYLIKRLFENLGEDKEGGEADGVATLTHLDRVSRPKLQQIIRWALSYFLSRPDLLKLGLTGSNIIRIFLPVSLRNMLPVRSPSKPNATWPAVRHARQMILLQGCAQRVIEPGINVATARVLDMCSISIIRVTEEVCCGALDQHLTKTEQAEQMMRRNIDAWWPHIEQGAEAIVCTASACGVQIKDYGHYLRGDDVYAKKALRVSALARDISEVLSLEEVLPNVLANKDKSVRVAFHAPCTLQHGLQLNGVVEGILKRCGFETVPVVDSHLCCGSAGTYSILNPELAEPLRANKLVALQTHQPDVITSANIGCIQHLKKGASVPVQHWIELLADCHPG
jgi:glycolate oxidase iron-sulfur subunit